MADSVPPAPTSTVTAPGPGAASSMTVSTTGPAPAPVPTAGTDTAPSSDQGQTRGLPYYEKLRRELRETIQKKRMMDKNMALLEDSIYRFEQSYLEETSAGNIIKGFDNYIKGSSGPSTLISNNAVSGSGPATRRKAQISDLDRVFSRSSSSFTRDSPAPSSATPSHSHAPTPTSATGTTLTGTSSKAAGKKNNRKAASVREDDDDDGIGSVSGKPAKRLKITYARE